jgi:hypothetical protein
MLFAVAALAFGHETPVERIVLDLLLIPGQFIGRSCRLEVGQLVRLTYLLPNGVLSILNHEGFRLYFGFSDYPSDPLHWFEPPRGSAGFYSMGASREAAAEIVALEDTEIVFSGCYIDDCVRVAPASAGGVWYSPRTCFLSTDLSSEVRIGGDAAGASIGFWTPSISTVYNGSNPIPTKGVKAHPFNIVWIRSEPTASQKYTIEFTGGNQRFAFSTIAAGVGRVVVGAAVQYEFQPVTGDFDYPALAGADSVIIIVFLVSGLTIILILCICAVVCCISIICRKDRNEFSGAPPLYDERPDTSDSKADADSERPDKDRESDSAGHTELPSLYETL